MNILITGVDVGQAYGAIKSLREQFKHVRIVGTEVKKIAVGFCFADKYYIVPLAKDSGYIPKMMEICKKEKIDFVLPCTDYEVIPLSATRKKFEKIGTRIIVSEIETVKVCRDKLLMYRRLHYRLPIVKTAALENFGVLNFPMIVKPKLGGGSRDIFRAESPVELAFYRKKYPDDYIVQEALEGQEYTVDCLADVNTHKLIVAIPRIRLETIAGFSSKGRTTKNKKLINIAKKLTNALKFSGPFNFQAREHNGKYYIFEINPRLAGGARISHLAGVNLPALTIKNALGFKIGKLEFDEVTVVRYIGEMKYGG